MPTATGLHKGPNTMFPLFCGNQSTVLTLAFENERNFTQTEFVRMISSTYAFYIWNVNLEAGYFQLVNTILLSRFTFAFQTPFNLLHWTNKPKISNLQLHMGSVPTVGFIVSSRCLCILAVYSNIIKVSEYHISFPSFPGSLASKAIKRCVCVCMCDGLQRAVLQAACFFNYVFFVITCKIHTVETLSTSSLTTQDVISGQPGWVTS